MKKNTHKTKQSGNHIEHCCTNLKFKNENDSEKIAEKNGQKVCNDNCQFDPICSVGKSTNSDPMKNSILKTEDKLYT